MRNDTYDEALGERLAAALRAEADRTGIPAGAWERFRNLPAIAVGSGAPLDPAGADHRPTVTIVAADGTTLAADGTTLAAGGTATGADPAEVDAGAPQTPRARRRTWRIPLIAAASVALIAVATAAIATSGFRRDGTAAPAAGGTPEAASWISVPIDSTGEIAAVIDGKDGGAPESILMDAPTAVSATAGPPQTARMRFDAPPPDGTLTTSFDLPPDDRDTFVNGSTTHSVGGALGFVSFAFVSFTSAAPRGAGYLWGAVGPDVTQVQVVVTTPVPKGADSRATSGSAAWVIDSGRGAHAFTPLASTATVWTDMAYGYHAFALKAPAGSSSATVYALGANDQTVQAVRFDFASGTRTELTLPKASASATAPFTTSTATSEPPLATTETGRPDTRGMTSPGYDPSRLSTDGAAPATRAGSSSGGMPPADATATLAPPAASSPAG